MRPCCTIIGVNQKQGNQAFGEERVASQAHETPL